MTARNGSPLLLILLCTVVVTVSSCGGGGSDGSATSTTTLSATAIVNHVPVVVDAGPTGVDAINSPFVSVTVCAPGSTSQCQTVDHILVDTGSTGLRVLASALGNGVLPTQLRQLTDASGNAYVECTQFVDGYSWGPVRLADVRMGGETAGSLPVQVIGDSSYPSSLIPASCKNVPGGAGEEDTVADFGANGVLGISNFLQDCGAYCAQAGQDGSTYNLCTQNAPITCSPASMPTALQVSNPVAGFAGDNNGVIIELPTVADAGAVTVTGTLVFGIGTETDNALGSATVFTVDPSYGTVITTYNGTALNVSFVDSGSNAYYFPDSTLTVCTRNTSFYCPSSTVSRTAQFQGVNGATATLPFSVSNADGIAATVSAFPTLAGTAGSSTLHSFDWGLPFFYGRNVYVAFEGATIGTATGPALAF